MAINLTNAGAANVGRDGSFLDLTSDWTVAFWLWQGATTPSGGASRVHWEEDSNGGAGPEYLLLGFIPNSNNIRLELYDGVTTSNSSAVTPTASTWYYTAITYVASTTTISFYTSGTLRGTIVSDLSAISWGTLSESINAVGWRDQAQAYTRSWQRVLSGAQLTAESLSQTPVLTTDLLANTPFSGPSDLTDTTVFSEDWTLAAGSLAYLIGPVEPANLTADTATAVGDLPATISQDVNFSTTTSTVWYTATIPEGCNGLGVYGFGAFGGGTVYKPRLVVFGPNTSATDPYLDILALNIPAQLPGTAGDVFWFRFVSANGNVATAVLTLSVLAAPTDLAPVGSLFVNDDTDGFPAVLLDQTDGTVLRFGYPVAAGEAGDVLPASGRMLLEDLGPIGADTTLHRYGPSFQDLGTIAMPTIVGDTIVTACPAANVWYAASRGSLPTTAKVREVSPDGDLTATIYDLGDATLQALAVNSTQTLFYYVIGTGTNAAVKRWNVTTNTASTNFLGGVVGYFTIFTGLRMLADDTLLAAYGKGTATVDYYIKRYQQDGTLLNTYSFGTAEIDRVATALDDPDSFWVWLYPHGQRTVNRYQQIHVTDGAVLTTFDVTQYETGVYQGDGTLTPTARFGPSFSCPFFLLRAPVSPPVTTITDPIRFVRIFPHMNDKQLLMFVSRLEIEMQRGVGLISGQGSDPAFLVSASHDGGMTFSPERFISPGKMGEYFKRAYALRWGRARDWVFKIVVTDPVHLALASVYLDVDEASS